MYYGELHVSFTLNFSFSSNDARIIESPELLVALPPSTKEDIRLSKFSPGDSDINEIRGFNFQ